MNRKTILIACLALTASACSATASTTTSPEAIVQPTPRTIIVEVTPRPTPKPMPVPTPVVIEDPTPEPEPTAAPVRTVTVKGKGSKTTKPFVLSGDYEVTVTGRATDLWGGNVIVELHDPEGELFFDELLTNEIVEDKGDKYHYETVIYGKDGRYYLDLAMPGGAWVVTFTPIAGEGTAL